MSWQATSWAKGVKTGSPSRKAVLMILAEHCDAWGYAWAGIELIAEEAELGYRQVRRVLQELVEGGFLGLFEPVKQGRGRFNLYRFAHGASAKAGAMPAEHPSLRDTFKPCRWASGADPGFASEAVAETGKGDKMSSLNEQEKGDIGDQERGHPEQEKGSPMTPEPIGTRFEPARARDPSALGAGVAHACEPTDQQAVKRPWETLSHARLVSAVAARRAERGTTLRLGEVTENERQVADAYITAVERGEVEDVHGLAAPHAVDVWRRHEQRIGAAVGEKIWKAWLSMLTPHADDGKTLTLAAPSRLIAGTVERDCAELIGKIVERKVVVEVHAYAGPAAHERQRREQTIGAGS